MLDVIPLSSDRGLPTAGRRTTCFAKSGRRRVVVVSVSGGMMDLGWAERALPTLEAPAEAFASDIEDDFGAATVTMVARLRARLTELERNERLHCNVQMVALERGERSDRLARIGGMRVWSFGPSGTVAPIGDEDMLSLSAGAPPDVVTAALIPDVHWKTSADRAEWVLEDEKTEADRMASRVRDLVDDEACASTLVIVTHPFWTSVDVSRLPSSHDGEVFCRALGDLVQAAHRTDAMAVVVAPSRHDGALTRSRSEGMERA